MDEKDIVSRIETELLAAMSISLAEVLHLSLAEIRSLRDRLSWRKFGEERPEVGVTVRLRRSDFPRLESHAAIQPPKEWEFSPPEGHWCHDDWTGSAEPMPDDLWQPITPASTKDHSVPVKKDQVFRTPDGRIAVAAKDHDAVAGSVIIANTPHEGGDFSYCCGQDWCRCMQ